MKHNPSAPTNHVWRWQHTHVDTYMPKYPLLPKMPGHTAPQAQARVTPGLGHHLRGSGAPRDPARPAPSHPPHTCHKTHVEAHVQSERLFALPPCRGTSPSARYSPGMGSRQAASPTHSCTCACSLPRDLGRPEPIHPPCMCHKTHAEAGMQSEQLFALTPCRGAPPSE